MSNEPHTLRSTPRQPWIALTLGLCCPGLGHLYCSRLARGLLFFLLSLLILPIAVLVAALASSTWALTVFIGLVLALQGMWLYSSCEAWRIAQRGGEMPCYDYQTPAIYGLFMAVGAISPVLSAIYSRQNLLEAYYIPTESMSPYLHAGDRILVNKMDWRTQHLERHDVIVFRAPDQPGVRYVKRLVALPGDEVVVEHGTIKVNGEPLPPTSSADTNKDAATPADSTGDSADQPQSLVVPRGACYVLGDNRAKSKDSREFGPIPLESVLGVAEYVYLPGDSWSRFGRLK
ncbi:MAG: signal peptidase I [Planctomycetes bacterium]|nr:signal peptidase I [Planctomycetota bacterium]